MKSAIPALTVLSLALASCGDAEDQTAFEEVAGDAHAGDVRPLTEGGEDVALELGPDFSELQLGPIVQTGPGAEATTAITGPTGEPAGQIRSYVACPAGVASCNPEDLSAGTVYTYVVEVTPAVWTSVFRTAQPVSGFTGAAGFDRAQAEAALPGDSELALRCVNEALVWAVNGGEGWNDAPITVYWQSASPPQVAEQAYQLIEGGATVDAPGVVPTDGFDSACS